MKSRDFSLAVCCLQAFLLSSLAIADDTADGDEKAAPESSISVDVELAGTSLQEATISVRFYLENIGFYSKRRHWDNPSTFTIYSDGSWFFYATRLANFDRTWADTGRTWRTRLDAVYYSRYDAANKRCAGQILHSNQYRFATVRYKQQRHNYTRRGDDAAFASISSQARCMRYQSWWY